MILDIKIFIKNAIGMMKIRKNIYCYFGKMEYQCKYLQLCPMILSSKYLYREIRLCESERDTT